MVPFLEHVATEMGLKMVAFMLTNITKESTELIYNGPLAKDIIKNAYGDSQNISDSENSIELNGVVSRKKQLVPKIILGIQQL